jgi:uncharacterized repeat protein (TIGR01451 family)
VIAKARSLLSDGTAAAVLLNCFWLTTAASGPLLAQAQLSGSNEAAQQGGTVDVQLTLSTNPGASAVQVDLLYDASRLTPGTPVLGSGVTGHLLASSKPTPGVLRLVIYSPTIGSVLPVGEIATVPFTAGGAAPFGITLLDPTAAEVATTAATTILPLTLTPGSIHIHSLEADVSVDLTASATLVADGDPLSYDLVVDNPGPDAVTGVNVSDTLPADLTAVAWTCAESGGATCAAAGLGDIDDTVDLPVGATATYTLAGTIDTTASFIDNIADLTAPAEVFDPDTTDNSDSISVDVCTVDHNVLTGYDIGGVASFNACLTLTAGPSFNIQDTGIVSLRSLGSVILTNGFSVETGGRLTVGAGTP